MLIAASIIVGLVLLVVGADVLVKGASRLAFAAGVSPLVVGLTVVAFGTSAPELAVSVRAAWVGEAGVGLGNIFGSNIANTFLILGASALITPLVVSRQLVRVDVPILIAVTAAVTLMSLDGAFSKLDGGLLVVALAGYLVLQARLGRSGHPPLLDEVPLELDAEEADPETARAHWGRSLLYCIVGLMMLVGGSHLLVDGAVQLARSLGISEVIIGLTIVAIGTSLPEIVTSIVAAMRGERDIAVGNVVGSNLFNLLAVLGTASLVAPGHIDIASELIRFDIPVTLFSAIICWPIFATGEAISRREGLLLLGGYVAYLGYQIYAAADAAT